MDNKCEGCIAFYDGVPLCNLFTNNRNDQERCPCRICIIKTMCSTTCEEYKKLRSELNLHYNDIKE